MTGIPKGAEKLGPGVYAVGDSMHIDVEELVIAAGGNPHSDQDCATAIEAVRRVFLNETAADGNPIPMEVRLKDG